MSGHPKKMPSRQDTDYGVDELPWDETTEDIPLQELNLNTPSTSTPGHPLLPTVLTLSHAQVYILTDSSEYSTVTTEYSTDTTTSRDGEYDVSTGHTDKRTEKSEETKVTSLAATDMQPNTIEPAKDTIKVPTTSRDGEYDISAGHTDKSVETNETFVAATDMEQDTIEPAEDTIAEPSSSPAPCTCMCCFCWKNCKKSKSKEQAGEDKQRD